MKIAIVKPDHIGDLVLSTAAIRVSLLRAESATLFVSNKNKDLASVLFGHAADIREIAFPHLSKGAYARGGTPDFREFDLVVFLRHDNVINPSWAELRCSDYVFPVDSHEHHQSVMDYGVIAPLVGDYDIDDLQFGADFNPIKQKACSAPTLVGLCIGSGFHANVWPIAYWVSLGRLLQQQSIRLNVICGPSESGLGSALAVELGLENRDLIIGGKDHLGFLERIAELDRVVASDGGAGHLCSLKVPVLSIFGPSPFYRYAPFGHWNRLLTRDLSCSPCCQWAAALVNGCVSLECMGGIKAADAVAALGPPYSAFYDAGAITLRDDVVLWEGTSHLGLSRKLEQRRGPAQVNALLPRRSSIEGHGDERSKSTGILASNKSPDEANTTGRIRRKDGTLRRRTSG